ncbi:FAD binding domain-containing protein [Chloropicon primus]|uniref:FAD-binding domain-containing protein n=1 Tax=Chloropicon primus TaxID=1764295 RepID=A0A5B8MFS0_9CHLO|nr:hypothetical protein A3770_02p18040 [Chloropicon primus]UPQ98495.1 FAD binding domain-containing protein [Chloropicon primus]|mmetsp:Transcript_4396/g.12951  ORF Transcript_4396/g.12951 Transcript_4396/m.12951 type:complete len:188 (-) Transcript_4396:1564-2127(-)|eukprot:QDZ19286.1 hypothetical protein A3770_02p18040 [Chloropicon primus]
MKGACLRARTGRVGWVARRGGTTTSCCSNTLEGKTAVVVGGGPCGLAAAIVLAKEGYEKVDVIERRESVDFFEPNLAFVFNANERGQALLDHVGAMDALRGRGVGSRQMATSLLYPSGKVKRTKLPSMSPVESFWISRQDFNSMLYEEVERTHSDRIAVHFGSEVTGIHKSEGGLGEDTGHLLLGRV